MEVEGEKVITLAQFNNFNVCETRSGLCFHDQIAILYRQHNDSL